MKSVFNLFCCLILVNFLHSQTIPYGNNTKVGKYYAVRGIKIYTEEYGKGKPVILLHGNGGSISSMASIIPYFSKNYRTIIFDERAQGKSIDPADSLSFEMMADDVAELLSNMKINSTFVVGWSDGGIVALELAMRHPEKVIKLAATGANIWPDSTAIIPAVWKNDKKYYDSQKDKLKSTSEEKNAWKLFMLDWNQPNISLASLNKIKTPALIICGDHDLIRIEHTVQIFQNIQKGQLWVLPNSSHGTLIEYPQKFYKNVNAFFNSK